MLILSLSRLVAPKQVDDIIELSRGVIPDAVKGLFDGIVSDITDRSAVPLISFAAIGLLWAASRGLNAVVRGVSEVYGKEYGGSFISKIVKAFLYTALFVIVITATLVVLVFGKYFKDAMTSSVGEVPMFIRYKEIIAFFVLALFFSLLYYLVSRGAFAAKTLKWERRGRVRFRDEFPGAAIAAFGWIIFSLAYSLYFDSVPRFSYLYGSLSAVVFLMLWLYFCILILLAGAEVNRALREKREKKMNEK